MPVEPNVSKVREMPIREEHPSWKALFVELRDDLKKFIQTRIQMLLTEMREKATAWKAAGIALGIGVAFGSVAFLLLTGALVVAIATVIGIGWSLLIVGVLYLIIAGGAGFMGYREFVTQGIPPERTLQVLKEDQAWLQNEVR